MGDLFAEYGLYWRPLGGNNIDQVSGHCYQYTDITQDGLGKKASTIIVDFGKFDNHRALGIKNSTAAVPNIRELLQTPFLNPEAIFLTHSHPDHLNGIVHYLKAGYKLPKLYGSRYTKIILEELYDEFGVKANQKPKFEIIADGDNFELGSLKIDVIAASHTCFGSLGFIITAHDGTSVYHTGDMKTDNSTYFRAPTNLKFLQQHADDINYVVADFCGITNDGLAVREVDTFKTLVKIMKKTTKTQIYIPVYPTHAEMYLIAFLAALKVKKDVIFYGNEDFYIYLQQIKKYGINFEKLGKNRIRVIVGIPEDMAIFNDNFVVIGSFNDIGNFFDDKSSNSLGIITSGNYFNPLRGQFNARNIKFIDTKDYPVLQGYGHGFIGDYEKINDILHKPLFIPMHCPLYVIDNFRELAQYIGINIATPTAKNNCWYKLQNGKFTLIKEEPATWIVVCYEDDIATFNEVWERPTSGAGFLKRTYSARRCKNQFKMILHKRKGCITSNGFKKICK